MIIAGTGHRPDKLGGYTSNVKARLETVAENWLEPRKADIQFVISGMALGWDQALANACWKLTIPFKAYVPFKGQEARWPLIARQEYQFLLDVAQEVVIVNGGGYIGWKMQARNEAMVSACTHVLALWNGSSGGTANCIAYAMAVKRPVINLWTTFVGQP